jgi:hypothetical protein
LLFFVVALIDRFTVALFFLLNTMLGLTALGGENLPMFAVRLRDFFDDQFSIETLF